MNNQDQMKKHVLTRITLVGLSVLFVGISVLVALTRGKNAAFITHKLKIGALLLRLRGAHAGCNPGPTSSDPPPQNEFVLFDTRIDLTQNNILLGEIRFRKGQTFSFRISDGTGQERQRDDLFAPDREFDEDTEAFAITLLNTLSTGVYELDFYAGGKEEQEDRVSWHYLYIR